MLHRAFRVNITIGISIVLTYQIMKVKINTHKYNNNNDRVIDNRGSYPTKPLNREQFIYCECDKVVPGITSIETPLLPKKSIHCVVVLSNDLKVFFW